MGKSQKTNGRGQKNETDDQRETGIDKKISTEVALVETWVSDRERPRVVKIKSLESTRYD